MNSTTTRGQVWPILLAALVLLCPSVASALDGAELTIYNSGQTLVTETRTVSLPLGMASVVFKNVPQTLDPTSVTATAKDTRILDVQFSYKPVNTANLLDEYVGKELTVVLPDGVDAQGMVKRKAILLSAQPQPIFNMDGEIYLGKYDAILLPKMPGGLQQEPILALTADSKSAAKRDVSLSYLMSGVNWRADYRLNLDDSGTKGTLYGWATIDNHTGVPFTGADIALVGGDVNQAPRSRKVMLAAAPRMESMNAAPEMDAQEVSQYHVYTAGKNIAVPSGSTKQIALLSADNISLEQEIVSYFRSGFGRRSGTITDKADVSLVMKNTSEAGLGKPLPAGLFRTFMPLADGRQILIGESSTSHVSIGQTIRLGLGSSFDVTVERTQTKYDKLGKNNYRMSWTAKIFNGKSTPQTVILREQQQGDWKVLEANQEYTVPDSGTLQFTVQVPPTPQGEPYVVTYTVQATI